MAQFFTPLPEGTPLNERFTTRLAEIWAHTPEYPIKRLLNAVESHVRVIAQSQVWVVYEFSDRSQIRVRLDGNVVECFDLHLVV